MINEETIRICKVVIDFGLYNIVQLSFFSKKLFIYIFILVTVGQDLQFLLCHA